MALLKPLAVKVLNKKSVFQGKTLNDDGGNKKDAIIALGIFLGTTALLSTNIFSPYFNHPLGIGIFMLTGVVGIYLTGNHFTSEGRVDSTILPTKSG